MIGLFKITDKRDGESYVIAESCMERSFKGKFYIPPIYRESCSTLSNGDILFGVLDDQSGFGAVLYKVDDKITDGSALTLSKDFSVKGNIDCNNDVNCMNLTASSTIRGSNLRCRIILTPDNTALIVAAGASGNPATLENTQIFME